jgi:hypothetical protein
MITTFLVRQKVETADQKRDKELLAEMLAMWDHAAKSRVLLAQKAARLQDRFCMKPLFDALVHWSHLTRRGSVVHRASLRSQRGRIAASIRDWKGNAKKQKDRLSRLANREAAQRRHLLARYLHHWGYQAVRMRLRLRNRKACERFRRRVRLSGILVQWSTHTARTVRAMLEQTQQMPQLHVHVCPPKRRILEHMLDLWTFAVTYQLRKADMNKKASRKQAVALVARVLRRWKRSMEEGTELSAVRKELEREQGEKTALEAKLAQMAAELARSQTEERLLRVANKASETAVQGEEMQPEPDLRPQKPKRKNSELDSPTTTSPRVIPPKVWRAQPEISTQNGDEVASASIVVPELNSPSDSEDDNDEERSCLGSKVSAIIAAHNLSSSEDEAPTPRGNRSWGEWSVNVTAFSANHPPRAKRGVSFSPDMRCATAGENGNASGSTQSPLDTHGQTSSPNPGFSRMGGLPGDLRSRPMPPTGSRRARSDSKARTNSNASPPLNKTAGRTTDRALATSHVLTPDLSTLKRRLRSYD